MSFRPPKRPEEHEVYTFDFTNLLRAGETITSVVWSVTVAEGTDPAPSAILSGAPTGSSPQSSHLVIGGVAGVTYRLHCLATTNGLPVQKLELCEELAVEEC